LSITNKDMWLSVGSAPCTFKLTNSWRWLAGFTNSHINASRKYFIQFKYYGIWQRVIGEWFLILRRMLSLSASMVISPWTISYLRSEWNPNSLVAKLTA
jgi:hypothetical protein